MMSEVLRVRVQLYDIAGEVKRSVVVLAGFQSVFARQRGWDGGRCRPGDHRGFARGGEVVGAGERFVAGRGPGLRVVRGPVVSGRGF
jgi:hypothetical protein